MDEESRGAGEMLPKRDAFKEGVEKAQKAFAVADDYFRGKKNIGDDSRYSHLGSVVDISHTLEFDDEEMTSSLQRLGYNLAHAQAIPAIYMGERGGILVDAVVRRRNAEVKPIVVLHEFIHRAAKHGGLQNGQTHFHEQLYEVLDFSKAKRETMKKQSFDEYKSKLAENKEIIRVFNEGLTQWAALKLANKTKAYNPPVQDETYADEASGVAESFQTTLSNRGFSTNQIEELMLDLALTGDFTKVRAALPLSDDLKKHGFSSDFYVQLLVTSAHNNFTLNRLNRILDSQS